MPSPHHPQYRRARKAAQDLLAVGWEPSEVAKLDLGVSARTIYELKRESHRRARAIHREIHVARDLEAALEAARA